MDDLRTDKWIFPIVNSSVRATSSHAASRAVLATERTLIERLRKVEIEMRSVDAATMEHLARSVAECSRALHHRIDRLRALRGSLAQEIVLLTAASPKSSGWWHAITGPFLQRLAQGREPFLKPRPPFLALCKAH